MRNRKIIILISLVFALFSCEKEEDLSKSEMLTQKPWILKSVKVSPPLEITGQGIFTEIFDLLYTPCDKDDLLIFKSNSNYTLEVGTLKCDATAPVTLDMGIWSLSYDETTLTLQSNYSLYPSEYQLIELTKSQMNLQYQVYFDTLYTTLYTLNDIYGH